MNGARGAAARVVKLAKWSAPCTAHGEDILRGSLGRAAR
jgi:hypothetical protein